MTLSLEKVRQIKELAKEGYNKTYVARVIGCNRKTVHKYWPKREEEKEPELSKRIFQLLEEGVSPVKIVEEVGYPGYIEEQIKAFKRLKQRELNNLLAKVDEANKTLSTRQAEIKKLQEIREKEHVMVRKLSIRKDELEKEILDKERRQREEHLKELTELEKEILNKKSYLSSLKNQIEDAKNEYFCSMAVRGFKWMCEFLENPTIIPAKEVVANVGIVMDAFYKWASLEENKRIFLGWEFPPFMDSSIENVYKALQILCKRFYKVTPQYMRDILVKRVLGEA